MTPQRSLRRAAHTATHLLACLVAFPHPPSFLSSAPLQAAPRDALIGDLAPAASRSACFGFAQSLRKWGSFVGAGLSYLLMRATRDDYQTIFLAAASVTVLSTLAFVALVPEHARPLAPAELRRRQEEQQAEAEEQQEEEQRRQQQAGPREPLIAAPAAPEAQRGVRRRRAQGGGGSFSLGDLARDVAGMGGGFYRTLALVSLYGLGHVNESLLEARAIEVGFGKVRWGAGGKGAAFRLGAGDGACGALGSVGSDASVGEGGATSAWDGTGGSASARWGRPPDH